jgi:hypothetical protein
MAVFSFGGKDFASKIPFLSKFLYSVKSNLGRLLQKADYRSRFTTGILNGFYHAEWFIWLLRQVLQAEEYGREPYIWLYLVWEPFRSCLPSFWPEIL